MSEKSFQNDYSELIAYLDGMFSLIATRQELDEGFAVVNKRLDELKLVWMPTPRRPTRIFRKW